MSSQRKLRKILRKLQRDGVPHVAYEGALRTINSVFLFKVLKGMVVSRPNPEFSTSPAGFTASFLSPARLRQFARDPEHDLKDSFLDEAIARGDECFALCEGERLAAYGWYAVQPTPIDPPDLRLSVPAGYVYSYKGFTHAHYRGRRLHAFVITLALQIYRSRGFKGLISYVESGNRNSFKSCARIGFDVFGSIYLSRVFGRYLKTASPGCKRLEFHIEEVLADDVHPRPQASDCGSTA